jgi:hypothetical protein
MAWFMPTIYLKTEVCSTLVIFIILLTHPCHPFLLAGVKYWLDGEYSPLGLQQTKMYEHFGAF